MRITDLEPGTVYVARQDVRDDRGLLVLAGDRQTFEGAVYRAGAAVFEVRFREETLVLSEDRQPDVVEHAEWFFEPAPVRPAAPRPAGRR